MASEPTVRVGVACFVWRDGNFLIQQRRGAHGEGTWTLPGGHLEMEESWAEAAAREVMEETGMTITNIRFFAATNDVFAGDKHYISIWMNSDWQSGEPSIIEPDRCIEIQWADFASLPEPLFEPCWTNLRAAKPELFA